MICRDKDIFEDLTRALGCEFISDLHYLPWHAAARDRLGSMRLKRYALPQLEDMAAYLFAEDVRFETHAKAEDYFRERRGTDAQEAARTDKDMRSSVAEALGCTTEEAEAAMQAFCRIAAERLTSGQSVELGELGTLVPRLHESRPQENSPRTPGKPHYAVVFKPSREMKKRLRVDEDV